MIHIAICDDERDFLTHLTALLERYALESGEEIKISTYSSGLDLVEAYDATVDLIFLDIKMNDLNGLKTAERIRQRDEHVALIFLTTLSGCCLEGYKYQAVNYIIKPIHYVRLKEEMDQWIKKHRQNTEPFIIVSNDTGKYKVFLKGLKFIETFNRNLLLHTEHGHVICYRKMKEMEAALGQQGFVRCHSGYLVNLFYVKRIEKLEIILLTDEKIPISQLKRKAFMKQLADYWGNQLL